MLLGQAAATPGDLTFTVLTELCSNTEGGWTKTLGPSGLRGTRGFLVVFVLLLVNPAQARVI